MDWNLLPTEQAVWHISVFAGLIICKLSGGFVPRTFRLSAKVYESTGFLSSSYITEYAKLKKAEKIEWNNRGISSFHAILVTAVSFYLIIISDFFKDSDDLDIVVYRKSILSDSICGFSLGYFISDLGMILWIFPALGGKEYILHHVISIYCLLLALVSEKGHVYILMTFLAESTTPFVNLRWYLDIAGHKDSKLYLYNGVAMFLGWLVARIFLFIYVFIHIYAHVDQVKTAFLFGFYSMLTTTTAIAVMNLIWFWKISKGLMKRLSWKKHVQ